MLMIIIYLHSPHILHGALTWIRTDNVHTGSSGSSLKAARPLTSSSVVPGTSSDLTTATHANMRLSAASAGHSMRSRFWSSPLPSDPLVLAPVCMSLIWSFTDVRHLL